MLTINAFLFFLALLIVAALVEPLAAKIRIPYTILLVLIGYLGSEIATKIFAIDTGINWENFHSIIFYVLLPILIFQAAVRIDINALRKNGFPIFMLSLPLMLISTGLIATGIYWGIDHPGGFPWIAALLAGALLSATDPAAVLALLKKANAPERLTILLEGESLFNDATAIVLFSIIISMALATGVQDNGWGMAITRFLLVFFGGLAVGAMIGIIAHTITGIVVKPRLQLLVTIIAAYSSYIVAENILHLSGVMAVLSAGLIIGSLDLNKINGNNLVIESWEFIAFVAEVLIFLLAGITITLAMFTDQWLAMLIGIAVVLIARCIVIFGAFPLMNVLPGIQPVSIKQQTVLAWGGIRGTVTLALALSLPLTLNYWYTIQSIAYGVVLFTLFMQTTTMNSLIKKLKLNNPCSH